MEITTLCYVEKDNKYLMLHRVKKVNDVNKDKWIGIGGHFEAFESPEECVLREIKEETGLVPKKLNYRALITFVQNDEYFEYMHLFTASDISGELKECDEGKLEWVDKKDIGLLNLWEGDMSFLREIDEYSGFFTMKLCYQGDKLVDCILNEY